MVSKKVYETYYRSKNRERYLEKRDQNRGLIYYNSFDSERGNFEEYLEDKAINIEQIVEAKLLMEELYKALDSLTEEERNLVIDLFFEEQTLREASKKRGISHVALMKRRDNILEKLNKLLKNINK
ncbi:RNA polymerase sigma factor [Anaerosphaera multitolerans]|uniref:Sigma-70 family RNA polymerase sigma factor n=1 Tax=Anaerosphaera multitolerans TaxID=2487351 RepID=A0A437S8M2_9FIRM|nr:sigma-70 family RNA polymerase sigma factor [Anaerosphaera multitolerans]RVU55449.1 sigma-70 family RNA polymerase sigma factor [Anaerosphaera multitolerans]